MFNRKKSLALHTIRDDLTAPSKRTGILQTHEDEVGNFESLRSRVAVKGYQIS
jgi:hypothetical protein